MILSKVTTVFRKDLKDVLRDRKTLIFMFLLPTLAIPLLMMGIGRFMIRTEMKRRTERVIIAIRPEDRDVLRGLIFQRFPTYDIGVLTSLLDKLRTGEAGEKKEEEPEELFPLRMAGPEEINRLESTWEETAGIIDKMKDRDLDLTPEEERIAMDLTALAGIGQPEYALYVDPVHLGDLRARGKAATAEQLPEGIRDNSDARPLAEAITAKKIQAAIALEPGFEAKLRSGEAMSVAKVYFDSTIPLSKEAENRVRRALDLLREGALQGRLEKQGLPSTFVKPLEVRNTNVAPDRKKIQAAIGSIFPYLIIIFCFLGAFYPALDIGAGEKERFTLETLLLSPASRFEIAAGKFLVILLTSVVAALLGLTSLTLSLKYGLFPEELTKTFQFSVEPLAVLVLAMLTVPVASVFASVLLSVSIYARSFKEGQSYAAPMQFLIILPAMISLIPDVQLSWRLALIPIVNVSLVMREFMKGEYLWGFFGVTLASTVLLAAISITFAARWFDREQVIFRN